MINLLKHYGLPFNILKIWQEDKLVRDFKACVDKDGNVGYYEYVSGNFFPKPKEEVRTIPFYTVHHDTLGTTYITKNMEFIDSGIDTRQISLFDEVMKGDLD